MVGTIHSYLYLILSNPLRVTFSSTLAVTTSGITNLTYDIVTCQAIYGFMAFGMNSTIWIVDSLLIARGSSLYLFRDNVVFLIL